MKTELGQRIMLELIERKYADTKTNKIRIDENDFRKQKRRNEAYSSDEIVDILLALEKSNKGKIKLISVSPQNDRPKNYSGSIRETEDSMFMTKKRYPDYFYVSYKPLEDTEGTLSLSREEGLCRIIDRKTVCYEIGKQRYDIILNLGKRFTSTKNLADSVGEKDLQKIRSQIGFIRKLIEKKLKLNGLEVIEGSSSGKGYRIGKKIKIIPC